jgi:hypothetical protein
MIVRADVAGRTAHRVSLGSSAIVDARGTVLRATEALSDYILVAEVDGHHSDVNATRGDRLRMTCPTDFGQVRSQGILRWVRKVSCVGAIHLR